MNVVFRIACGIKVHDNSNVFYVQPSRSHIRGHKYFRLAAFETVERDIALSLITISMNGLAPHAHSVQTTAKLVTHFLGLCENDYLTVSIPQCVHELRLLIAHRTADNHLLLNVRVCLQFVGITNPDLHRILKEVLRHPTYLFWPRGGEHHCLPPGWHIGDNLSNLGLKAHVQHAISLIQHKEFDIAKADHATLDEVVEPAGCACQELWSATQVCKLRTLWCTAISQRCHYAGRASKTLCVRVDLHCQLSCWCHDQHDGGP
mmetsp:Transcript_71930/g.142703  ORF Transcript_71930/g.142703 Transcript_71930/m.142703 type:complete len:261 (-) Transcript_71930:392-1174(-)